MTNYLLSSEIWLFAMNVIPVSHRLSCTCLWCWNSDSKSKADNSFLRRDASQTAVLLRQVGCLSVRLSARLSVTFRYRDHIGWNFQKLFHR